jgi:hypothetical protein
MKAERAKEFVPATRTVPACLQSEHPARRTVPHTCKSSSPLRARTGQVTWRSAGRGRSPDKNDPSQLLRFVLVQLAGEALQGGPNLFRGGIVLFLAGQGKNPPMHGLQAGEACGIRARQLAHGHVLEVADVLARQG